VFPGHISTHLLVKLSAKVKLVPLGQNYTQVRVKLSAKRGIGKAGQ